MVNISLTGVGEDVENISSGIGLPPAKWFIPYPSFDALILAILISAVLVDLIRRRK